MDEVGVLQDLALYSSVTTNARVDEKLASGGPVPAAIATYESDLSRV